jgi:tryptophan synthase alpha chain
VETFLDDIRAVAPLPVLAGFGVRDARTFRAVTAHADGAIVGSALIEAIERGEDPVVLLGEIAAGTAPVATEGQR